jgi:hypothetical protein
LGADKLDDIKVAQAMTVGWDDDHRWFSWLCGHLVTLPSQAGDDSNRSHSG